MNEKKKLKKEIDDIVVFEATTILLEGHRLRPTESVSGRRSLTVPIKLISLIPIIVIFSSFPVAAQSLNSLLTQASKIPLLESNREDARRILVGYEYNEDDKYFESFSSDEIDIEITYSTGECAEDSDEQDAEEIWNVKEGTITRIEISLNVHVKADEINLHISRFTKDPRFPDDDNSFVIHDKSRGVALKTKNGEVQSIILFPSRSKVGKLCREHPDAEDFYSRKSWFSQSRPNDLVCGYENQVANVENLDLSASEVDATRTKLVSVTTTASDSENDVLTFKDGPGRFVHEDEGRPHAKRAAQAGLQRTGIDDRTLHTELHFGANDERHLSLKRSHRRLH